MTKGPATALIRLTGLTKIYGTGDVEVHALRGVDLTVTKGESVAITGPSGSGKSTAMNINGCLDTPTPGSYDFMGYSIGGFDRDQRALLRHSYLGFVFQGCNLLARTSTQNRKQARHAV